MSNEKILKLFDAYADDLYRFAVSYVGSWQEAEDIVQEVFLKLLSKNILLRSSHEKAYLFTVTANMCKDHLRAGKVRQSITFDQIEDYMGDPSGFCEDDKVLLEALLELDEKYRAPLYLHFYAGYTYKEVAKILRLSESAVAMRISRGKTELKGRLEE